MIKVDHPGYGFLPNPDPASRGQKGTGSRIRIRIRNTEIKHVLQLKIIFLITEPIQPLGADDMQTTDILVLKTSINQL
jgi:hypothetical protein